MVQLEIKAVVIEVEAAAGAVEMAASLEVLVAVY
jgi:hypothetical protein